MPSDVPSVPPVARRDVTVYPAGVHGTLDGLPTLAPDGVPSPSSDLSPDEGR